MSPEPLLVHFAERRLGPYDSPQQSVRDLSGPQRLANVLLTGLLRAFPVTGSQGDRIVAASDISHAELHHAFRAGLNTRGQVPPWAVVLDRQAMWTSGTRPVIYAEAGVSGRYRDASEQIRGPGWGSLVVRTDLDPQSRNDWTHEREWRYCFSARPDSAPPAEQPVVRIQTALRAVIVGEQGWLPSQIPDLRPELTWTVRPTYSFARWFWNGQTLIHDGGISVSHYSTGAVPPRVLSL